MKEMTIGINTQETKEVKNNNKKRIEDLISTLKGKKVLILGHDNIDVDATLSGILMSKLLDFLKIENQFCIIEKVKENDTYEIISELIGINMKDFQSEEECENRDLFLVDHFETIHNGNVIGCIDHHPTQQEKNYKFMYVRNSCATAFLIYELMQEINYPISEEDAKMIVVSMMVDTTAFRSSKTIKEEVLQAKKIAEEYQLDYEFLEKYCLCLTPIDRLTKEKIITNGQKWYNYNGKKVGSAYLQLYGLPSEVQIKEWLNDLKDNLWETDSVMLEFIIFDVKDNMTYEYQIMDDCIKEVIHKGILSRGKDIMPLIEARYLEDKSLDEKTEIIVEKLSKSKKKIATMESCTAGLLASQLTNVEGASEVLKESYVTYSNEAKIKIGVPKETINKHTVYSSETAIAMAEAVRKVANANIGVGITGQLGRIDPNNPGAENNRVWYCIKDEDKEYNCKLFVFGLKRSEKKEIVIREIIESIYTLK